MLKPIKTAVDNENALKRIYELIQLSPDSDSPDFD